MNNPLPPTDAPVPRSARVRLQVIGSEAPPHGRGLAASRRYTSLPLPSVGGLALSIDGQPCCLINAPIGLGLHLRRYPELAESAALTVVLTDAQLDHVSGLIAIRHGPPIDLHATPAAFEKLTQELPLLQVVERYCGVRWHLIGVCGDRRAAPVHIGAGAAVRLTALAAAGAVPRYSAHWGRESITGDAIALMIENVVVGQRLLFVPGPAALTEDVLDLTRPHDTLVVGTGCSDRRCAPPREHAQPRTVPLRELRRRYPALGRIVLQADLPVQAEVASDRALGEAGIEMAFDGAEFEL